MASKSPSWGGILGAGALLLGGVVVWKLLIEKKEVIPGSYADYQAGGQGLIPDSLQSWLSGLTAGLVPTPARQTADYNTQAQRALDERATQVQEQQNALAAFMAQVQTAVGNAQYMAASGGQRIAGGVPVFGGAYQTPTAAGVAGGLVPFSSIYNANMTAAGATQALAQNAAAKVAATIGGSSAAAWQANLQAKGFSAASAASTAQWHASRGDVIRG